MYEIVYCKESLNENFANPPITLGCLKDAVQQCVALIKTHNYIAAVLVYNNNLVYTFNRNAGNKHKMFIELCEECAKEVGKYKHYIDTIGNKVCINNVITIVVPESVCVNCRDSHSVVVKL